MRKSIKLAAVALFTASVACFSSAAPVTILNTGFTSPAYTDGDLAGQQAWAAVTGTATNALNVVYASGNGYATTFGTMLSVTNGNYVYLTNVIPNVTSNELAGSLDFNVSTDLGDLGGFDFMHIGLSATSTNKLWPEAQDDVYLSLATSPGGIVNVRVRDGAPGETQISTLLFAFPAESMGWNISTNYNSDPLRLTWNIRKTAIANTYKLSATLTNLNMATNGLSGVATLLRASAYSASSTRFLIGHPQDAYSSNKLSTTMFTIDNMSITNQTNMVATLTPSAVTANSLNRQVRLTWPLCLEAEKVDIYRSFGNTNSFQIIPGATNLTGNIVYYGDTNVVNGNVYYYQLVWRAGTGVPAVSDPVIGEPNPEVTGTIIDTSFTSTNYVAGDLATQKLWRAISASGKPAFKVDPTGNGYADTTPYSNFFNNVTGNQVFWNQITSNSVSAAWSGTVVFKLNATTEDTKVITNVVFDVTNINSQAVAIMQVAGVFNFGISSDSATTILDPKSKAGDALISVRTAADGAITVQLNGYNSSANTMITVPRANAGWDPEWSNFRNTNAPDFETDPITLNWKLRKTPVTSVYSATASLTVGTNSYTGTVEYTDETTTAPVGLWSNGDTTYARFGMSHDFTSQTNSTNTMVNVALDSLLLNHNYDEPMMYAAPSLDRLVIGNTNVLVKWSGAPEAATNAFEIWRSTGYGKTNSADFIKIATLPTNTYVLGAGYTYTDYGLTNQFLYNYKVGAVYTGQTNFSAVLSVRARDKEAVVTWEPISAGQAFSKACTTNGLIITGYGSYTEALDGTNRAIMYPGVIATYTNTGCISVFGWWQMTPTNGILSTASAVPTWIRLQSPNYYQFQVGASNRASHLVYFTNSPAYTDLSAGEYAWDSEQAGGVNHRAALRQNGKWYVSAELFSDRANVIPDLKDPTNQWRELMMPADALMGGTNNPVETGLTFTNVDAIGFFIDQASVNFRVSLLKLSKIPTPLATYTITTDVINSNATPGVSITPQNPTVRLGDSPTFTISGNVSGTNLYRVVSLQTNSMDVGGLTFSNDSTTVNFTWYDVTANGSLTATFTNRLFTLLVTNGAGSGSYTNGERVAIEASAPEGMVFDQWIGDTQYVDNIYAPTATVTMPPQDIALSATYTILPPVWYTLTVNNGTGSGSYTNGQQVAIAANLTISEIIFDRWTGDVQHVADIHAAATTVTMPASNITVTATYVTNPPPPSVTQQGTPYAWLAGYGLTNYEADDLLDQDADGLKTWQEYIAGTVPTSGTSSFKVTYKREANGPAIQWNPVVTGRVYGVHWSTNLLNSFQPLETNIVWPQASYADTVYGAESLGFYEVKVQLAPFAQSQTNIVSAVNRVGYTRITLPPAGAYQLAGLSFVGTNNLNITFSELFGTNMLTRHAISALADKVIPYVNNGYVSYYQKPDGVFRVVGGAAATNPVLNAGAAFWLQSPSGATLTNTIYLGGVVPAAQTNKVVFKAGMTLFANPYPTDMDFNSSNLTWVTAGATANNISSSADKISIYNSATKAYTTYYLRASTGKWHLLGVGSWTNVVLPVASGAWYDAKKTFTNSFVIP